MATTSAPRASTYNVEFTVKVSYDTKHHAKELKCRWSPDDKKWKRSFTNTGQYGYSTAEKMYYAIASFVEQCQERDVQFEFDEDDFDELKDHVKAMNAHMRTFCRYFPIKTIKHECLINEDADEENAKAIKEKPKVCEEKPKACEKKHVPIAPGPIDAYRGTGPKKVKVVPIAPIPLVTVKLCKTCNTGKVPNEHFDGECKECYYKRKNIKICVDCDRSIDHQYVRCFNCNGIFWRDLQDGKIMADVRNGKTILDYHGNIIVDPKNVKCLISDD
jgi:hypothetical protein